ncbi:MAG: SDR family NAD(P)-dependent oxidoreductase [Sphaerochaetaceae bacterium]|nr:SDR family NAD(P)-dependent oxidoreductase [Sphaerochaetaceae bacterium]
MSTKYVIITGSTSGIGFETAKDLYLKGYYLILANRNQQKALKIKAELTKLKKVGNIDLLEIDLSSFSSIIKFAEEVKITYPKIDILINNAGVFSRTKAYTKEGYELAKGVNYLGTYYLTELLLPFMNKQCNSKIIMLSSVGCYYGKINLSKSFFQQKNNDFKDYFDSKLAALIYTKYIADKFPNVIIKAADPGIAYSSIWKWKSNFGRTFDKLYQSLFSSAKKASRVVVELADTNKYDKTNHILYKYRKKRRLPRSVKKFVDVSEFIRISDECIYNY